MPNIAINPLSAKPSVTQAATQSNDGMPVEDAQTSFSATLAHEMQDKRGLNKSDARQLKHAKWNKTDQADAPPSVVIAASVAQDNPLLALALPAAQPPQMPGRIDETHADSDQESADAVLMPVMLAMERMANAGTSLQAVNDAPKLAPNNSQIDTISKPVAAAMEGMPLASAPGSTSPDHSTGPALPTFSFALASPARHAGKIQVANTVLASETISASTPSLPAQMDTEHTVMLRSDVAQLDATQPNAPQTDTAKPALQISERAPRAESSIASTPNITPTYAPNSETFQPQAVAQLEPFRLAMNNTIAPQVSAAIPDELGSSGWGKSLGQQISWMVAGGHQTAELHLHPADMGPLQVVLSVQNNQAELMFVSREPAVRQAIEAAMPHLKDMMADAGISLGQTSVNAESPKDQSTFGRPERHEMSRFERNNANRENTFVAASVSPVRRSLGLVDTFA
ncbi:MAG: flagellar hook-length control protein FliK [Thiobacillaceae bacterium]